MWNDENRKKSGQALIFLMVVLVVGIFAVIWNFDLGRVIRAKVKMRNSADAAVLAGARWQGYTLNMIGELNLIQAAILSSSVNVLGDPVPEEVGDLHELRERLAFVGPLAAFSVAQQAAFNNGAYHDPLLADDLLTMADEVEGLLGYVEEPYPDAFAESADLLRSIANNGVAVGSYTLDISSSGNPLESETFYTAVAKAVAGYYCAFYEYMDLLSYYTDYTSWQGGVGDYTDDTDILNLKVSAFTNSYTALFSPDSSLISTNTLSELEGYLETNDVVETHGDSGNILAIKIATNVAWTVYDSSWNKTWPEALLFNSTLGTNTGDFPIRANVLPEYNYLGAQMGVQMESTVEKGIMSRSDDDFVELDFKSKAMPFGYLPVDPEDVALQNLYPDGKVPPNYFGFVLPAFHEVHLIHSDLGDPVLPAPFYRHVKYHLHAYLSQGLDGLTDGCKYCQLLRSWETLDKEAIYDWLEEEYNKSRDDNSCISDYIPVNGGGPGGGATGGS